MITFEIKSEKKITFEYSSHRYHRRGRKACRVWYPNGKKYFEGYYINDKFHRLNRPSSTYWYENGQKWSERYCINGKYQSSKSWNKQGEPQW